MNTASELTDFIQENDVKFVRFSFIDLDGRQRNLSVMAEELPSVINCGMPFSAAAAEYGKGAGDDLLLFPDVNTIHILPWRPQHGRVARFLCYVKDAQKRDAYFDSRSLLKNTLAALKGMGITSELGTDCEFYLFKTDDEGNPTKNTHDHAGYFDIAPLDKGENVRREICLCLEEMGIKPLSSHHERGPGQNEINFIATQTMDACDNYMIFRSVVKAIASRNGLFASFMPKPIENESGNGLAPHPNGEKCVDAAFDNFTGKLCQEWHRLRHGSGPIAIQPPLIRQGVLHGLLQLRSNGIGCLCADLPQLARDVDVEEPSEYEPKRRALVHSPIIQLGQVGDHQRRVEENAENIYYLPRTCRCFQSNQFAVVPDNPVRTRPLKGLESFEIGKPTYFIRIAGIPTLPT